MASPLWWVSVAFLETSPTHQDLHQSGAHCSLALMVTAVLATAVRTMAREERADCATGRPIPPSAAIRGPSLPPPTSRQGRVGFRGFGSDFRVVTRTHRGSPLLSRQRGSQDRVHSRVEAVGILGHPSLCPDGGTWAPAGKRQSLSIVGNHSTHPDLARLGARHRVCFTGFKRVKQGQFLSLTSYKNIIIINVS